jgi:hypothetical protein
LVVGLELGEATGVAVLVLELSDAATGCALAFLLLSLLDFNAGVVALTVLLGCLAVCLLLGVLGVLSVSQLLYSIPFLIGITQTMPLPWLIAAKSEICQDTLQNKQHQQQEFSLYQISLVACYIHQRQRSCLWAVQHPSGLISVTRIRMLCLRQPLPAKKLNIKQRRLHSPSGIDK